MPGQQACFRSFGEYSQCYHYVMVLTMSLYGAGFQIMTGIKSFFVLTPFAAALRTVPVDKNKYLNEQWLS